jgi:hypothetical protein
MYYNCTCLYKSWIINTWLKLHIESGVHSGNTEGKKFVQYSCYIRTPDTTLDLLTRQLYAAASFLRSLIHMVGGRLSHLVHCPLLGLLFQPRMMMMMMMMTYTQIDECGVVDGMRIVTGDRSTRRKPPPEPLRQPQASHDLTWDRTRPAAVWRLGLVAWAMAPPKLLSYSRNPEG